MTWSWATADRFPPFFVVTAKKVFEESRVNVCTTGGAFRSGPVSSTAPFSAVSRAKDCPKGRAKRRATESNNDVFKIVSRVVLSKLHD